MGGDPEIQQQSRGPAQAHRPKSRRQRPEVRLHVPHTGTPGELPGGRPEGFFVRINAEELSLRIQRPTETPGVPAAANRPVDVETGTVGHKKLYDLFTKNGNMIRWPSGPPPSCVLRHHVGYYCWKTVWATIS